jgi:hypothetical protein
MANMPSDCNSCGPGREHEILWSSDLPAEQIDGAMSIRASLVRCQGCKELTLRREVWTDFDKSQVSYSPERMWHRQPDWLASIETADPNLFGLLGEVYGAKEGQVRLLSMGVRAVIDHMMNRILGADRGGFAQKLREMVSVGHISERQRTTLETVIDAGSASSHRGFKPPKELLEEMFIVMEHIVREHFITAPMLETARLNIPPRPPRRQRSS